MIASPKQYKDATAASFDSTVVSLIESFAARGKPMPDRSKKEEARSKTEAALRIWGYNESSERGTGCGTTSQALLWSDPVHYHRHREHDCGNTYFTCRYGGMMEESR